MAPGRKLIVRTNGFNPSGLRADFLGTTGCTCGYGYSPLRAAYANASLREVAGFHCFCFQTRHGQPAGL